MFSFLREAPGADGKPGCFSGRRVSAFILLIAALGLFAYGLQRLGALPPNMDPRVVVLPGAICLLVMLVLYLCTTTADIVAIIHAARDGAEALVSAAATARSGELATRPDPELNYTSLPGAAGTP